jgi:ankyrin repeat protein
MSNNNKTNHQQKTQTMDTYNTSSEFYNALCMAPTDQERLAIIKRCADINIQDISNWTALMHAINKGKTEIAKSLINQGAKIDLQNKSGDTALIMAIKNNNTEITKILINKGAKTDLQGYGGDTALVWAIRNKDSELAELLALKTEKKVTELKQNYVAMEQKLANAEQNNANMKQKIEQQDVQKTLNNLQSRQRKHQHLREILLRKYRR